MPPSDVTSFFLPGQGGGQAHVNAWRAEVNTSGPPRNVHLDNAVSMSECRSPARSVGGARSEVFRAPDRTRHNVPRSEAGGRRGFAMGQFGHEEQHPEEPRARPARRSSQDARELEHIVRRDVNAALRRGYPSSESGDTAIDDPVPEYNPRAAQPPPYGARSHSGAIENEQTADGETRARLRRRFSPRPTGHGTGADPCGAGEPGDGVGEDIVDPDDSISVADQLPRNTPPSLRGSSASTRSTVSLTDSTVDRIAAQLAVHTLSPQSGGRKEARVVSDSGATSARRAKHHGRKLSRADRLSVAGQLLFGGNTTVAKRRGETVFVRRRSIPKTIPE
jgi:hypothetical protein